jgi:hypothetical protein
VTQPTTSPPPPAAALHAIVDNLVRHEREGTVFDVKRTAYPKPRHEALLKDVLAMANAHAAGDRFIVCGMHLASDGKRTLTGVPRETFADAAQYQQLVEDNIVPSLHLDYFPHEVDGTLLGVLRISGCTERPYAMRKKFCALERGHMWIRKGTHQLPIPREDLEQIYAERYQARGFMGPVHIGWEAPGHPSTLTVPVGPTTELPSARAAREIRAVLEARHAEEQQRAAQREEDIRAGRTTREVAELLGRVLRPPHGPLYPLGSFVPFEHRDTDQLRHDLHNIGRIYAKQDDRAVYAEWAQAVNIVLRNDGTEHVQAARVEVDIPVHPGLGVVKEPPDARETLFLPGKPGFYPEVTIGEDIARAVVELGDVRHYVPARLFGEPLRLLVGPSAAGATIPVQVRVHGKNIPVPIVAELTLVVEPLPEAPPLRRSRRGS